MVASEHELGTREGASAWGCLRAVILVFLVFILVLLGSVAYIGLRSESLTEEIPATIHPVAGTAQIQRSGTTGWMPVVDLWPLGPGDALRAGESAGVLLYFFDGSRAYLGPGAELVLHTSARSLDRPPLLSPILKRVFPDYPGPLDARTETTVAATLRAGSALAYAGRLASPESYFRLDTSNATIQGSATVYSVAIDSEGATLVEALTGPVAAAGLATLPDESSAIAASLLQPGRALRLPPLPAGSETSETAARQRGAAWSVLGVAARTGALPMNAEGLAIAPAREDNTLILYRLAPGPPPTPTPMPTIAPDTASGEQRPPTEPPPEEQPADGVQPATSEQPANGEQPADSLPPGLSVTPIDDMRGRLASAQETLQPKGISVRSLSERDLGARLPSGAILRIKGGGVVTANVQGIAYTVTVAANNGALSVGGLPPGVNVPELPAKIISVASEPGELVIVYQERD